MRMALFLWRHGMQRDSLYIRTIEWPRDLELTFWSRVSLCIRHKDDLDTSNSRTVQAQSHSCHIPRSVGHYIHPPADTTTEIFTNNGVAKLRDEIYFWCNILGFSGKAFLWKPRNVQYCVTKESNNMLRVATVTCTRNSKPKQEASGPHSSTENIFHWTHLRKAMISHNDDWEKKISFFLESNGLLFVEIDSFSYKDD